MALTYVPAGRISAYETNIKDDDEAFYWKRLQQLAVFQEPGPVTSVAIRPERPYTIATTSSVRLTLYDTVLYEPINMFSRFKQAVFGARFRKDGNLIAVGGEEGKLRVFDVESGTGTGKAPLRSVKASAESIRVADFSQNGRTIFSMADDGKIKQWDLSDTGTTPIVDVNAHCDSIRAGIVSNYNNNIVVSGGYDHKIKLWDLRNLPTGPSVEIDVGAPVEKLVFLRSESLLASASTNIIKIWDLSAGGRLLASIQQHHKTITSLALDGDGKYLLSGAIDRRINVVNISNFTITYSMSMAAPVLGLAVSADDNTLAVGMGNLLAIHKRAPLKEILNAVSYKPKSSIITNPSSTVEIKQKGEDSRSQEISAKEKPLVKLERIDKMLKSYKHAAAIKTMFSQFYLAQRREQIVGWLQTIIHRKALHAALAGQETETIHRILGFLYKNLMHNNYFDILRHVVEAICEIYAEDQLDEYLVKHVLKIRDSISRELTIQKQISQTIGILEMIINGSKEIKSEFENSTTDIFGDVVVTNVSLPHDVVESS